MLKRLIITLSLAFAACFEASAMGESPDSLDLARLDKMLDNYVAAISHESLETKMGECDFLINSVNDSLMTQHIALRLYDYYKESQLMGEEAVAIHIYDTWFKPGLIKMRSDYERFDADLFANFNRSTLLGMKAPEITMISPCGCKVIMPTAGSHSILFFYDASCGKCQLEAKMLPQVLKEITFPARFYAVYCGQDKKAWRKFRREFKVQNRKVGVVHVWDPEVQSDYLRLYGVISTPRLYFTDTDCEILGRRLEIESLAEIIHYICDYYGQTQKQ